MPVHANFRRDAKLAGWMSDTGGATGGQLPYAHCNWQLQQVRSVKPGHKLKPCKRQHGHMRCNRMHVHLTFELLESRAGRPRGFFHLEGSTSAKESSAPTFGRRSVRSHIYRARPLGTVGERRPSARSSRLTRATTLLEVACALS